MTPQEQYQKALVAITRKEALQRKLVQLTNAYAKKERPMMDVVIHDCINNGFTPQLVEVRRSDGRVEGHEVWKESNKSV